MEKERDRVARRRRKGESACSHNSQEKPTPSADIDVKVPKTVQSMSIVRFNMTFCVAGLNARGKLSMMVIVEYNKAVLSDGYAPSMIIVALSC